MDMQINTILLSERIKAARTIRNRTLDELAEQISVHKSTISRYEQGKIERPKLPVIQAIALALQVSPMWLIGKSNCMNSADLVTNASCYWDGERLCEERTLRGISANYMATALGLSEDEYRKLESSDIEPTFPTLIRLCGLFSSDINYICHWLSKLESPTNDTPDNIPFSLLNAWRMLNQDGRELLTEYADTLIQSKKYEITMPERDKKEA